MIHKAVIPVAGLGTRLLPLTKAMPKEMLPVGRKPTIHHVVDELAEAGVDQILFITARHKRIIEDYFDHDHDMETRLRSQKRDDLADSITMPDIKFMSIRQSKPAGNGDAVKLAQDFIGTDPVVIAWGDAIIHAPPVRNVVQRMIDVHQQQDAACTIAVEIVPEEKVSRYAIVHPIYEADDAFPIDDLVEKPDLATAPSGYAVSARYICNPDIIPALDRTPPGRGGELWLVDAIRTLLQDGKKVWCVPLGADCRRYDIGSPRSYWEASVDFALDDEEEGTAFQNYIRTRMDLIDQEKQ